MNPVLSSSYIDKIFWGNVLKIKKQKKISGYLPTLHERCRHFDFRPTVGHIPLHVVDVVTHLGDHGRHVGRQTGSANLHIGGFLASYFTDFYIYGSFLKYKEKIQRALSHLTIHTILYVRRTRMGTKWDWTEPEVPKKKSSFDWTAE